VRDIGEIRLYVRQFLDLETEDLPDVLIDTWIKEGYRKVVRATRRWPHFEDVWTATTEAGVAELTLPAAIEEIASIEGPWGILQHVGESAARDDYNRWSAAPTSGDPLAWSKHGGTVRLYPTPSSAIDLRILGYRPPSDWMAGGAGNVPDFPEDCEDALLTWVMHRAYTHQDDPELAAQEAQRFGAAVEEMVSHYVQGDLALPLTFGGGRTQGGRRGAGRPIPWGY
jgi:hypothetical protein